MNTVSLQAGDGIFYEIDLGAIERVAELEEAVLNLQQAVVEIAAGNSAATLQEEPESESGEDGQAATGIEAVRQSLAAGTLARALEESLEKAAGIKLSIAAQEAAIAEREELLQAQACLDRAQVALEEAERELEAVLAMGDEAQESGEEGGESGES